MRSSLRRFPRAPIQKDDVLITNFNNDGNLQGLGTTIVDYNPTTKKLSPSPRCLATSRDVRAASG